MSSLSEISTAFTNRLGGLQVSWEGNVVDVVVVPGLPEPEFLKKRYPAYGITLLSLDPAYERQDIQEDTFGYDATTHTVYEKPLPEPWDFHFQIDAFSGFMAHADPMMEHVLKNMNRRRYLEVGTAQLAEDVSEGDTQIFLNDVSGFSVGELLILDKSTPGVRRVHQQAFYVLGVGTNQSLQLEPAAAGDFLAATTACYKARYELVFDTMLMNDGQDAHGRPYLRRTFLYRVWGDLDYEEAQQVAAVKANGVELNWSIANLTATGPNPYGGYGFQIS